MSGDSTAPLIFPRSRRLKQQGDFARARARGRRLVCGCLIVNILPRPDLRQARLGVVTGKSVGNAVARSRARRLLRESFRRHQPDLAGPVDLVLVARPSIAGKKFADVERDYLRVLKQAGITGP
jgi:ribonuclease P protein component